MRITLQFSATNGPISRLIRWRTHSHFSHVDFVLADGRLLGSQFKAKGGDGVRLRIPRYEKFNRIALYHVDVPDEVGEKAMCWARSQIGKPYDLEGALGIFFGQRDWHEDDSWFCFEYVAEAFDQAKYPLVTTPVNRVLGDMLIASGKLVFDSYHTF
jgi:uncharacterized protein YycO